MYNWTNDLPEGSKKIFDDVLDTFKQKESVNILEIGTFVGMSLIRMLQHLPQSQGYVIDNWKLSDFEIEICKKYSTRNVTLEGSKQQFLLNVNSAGMGNRVRYFEGDSVFYLRKLTRDNFLKFDFIYVDGSHKCLDVFADLILSWEILKPGGILGIDDYLWTSENNDNFSVPRLAVDKFLEKYIDEYEIISKQYRVFLKKLPENSVNTT